MAKERFASWQPKGSSKIVVRQANDILDEITAQGYRLTLRQLYYAMVSRDLIPNSLRSYKRLGKIINDARLAGLVDWHAIEDRTRNIKGVPHWREPQEIIMDAAESFRLDKWIDQEYRLEVWVEKDALIGVVEQACRELDVRWFSCRGYTSQTAVYDASKRINNYLCARQEPVIIHLGDHDPSWKDMTRDIEDRLFMFNGSPVTVERIALNWDQIEEYNPPPNPAKETDSRFEKYQEEFGDESWELDALDVRVIHEMIQNKIATYRDDALYARQEAEEKKRRELLASAAGNWEKVAKMLIDFEKEKKRPARRRKK